VSRLPSIHFLQPRLEPVATSLSNGFYVLNPSGDLASTQAAFEAPFQARGWRGIAGRAPSAAEMSDGLLNSNVYVYCGHSGGERYLKAESLLSATLSKGRQLSCTALLVGCSSGLLQHQGQYDATGIVMAYLMAGWYVHRRIFRFSKSAFKTNKYICLAVRRWLRICGMLPTVKLIDCVLI
jgi:hypothetical protein